MNVNPIIAAVGGAAMGVGGTLLVQKLRKDSAEITVEVKEEAVLEHGEPENVLAYRDEAARINAQGKGTSPQALSSARPTSKTDPKKAVS